MVKNESFKIKATNYFETETLVMFMCRHTHTHT